MADAAPAAAEEPAVQLEFQNFGSSGEGVVDGRIGRSATPGEDRRPRAAGGRASEHGNGSGGLPFRACLPCVTPGVECCRPPRRVPAAVQTLQRDSAI
jgi:hypothetical protein